MREPPASLEEALVRLAEVERERDDADLRRRKEVGYFQAERDAALAENARLRAVLKFCRRALVSPESGLLRDLAVKDIDLALASAHVDATVTAWNDAAEREVGQARAEVARLRALLAEPSEEEALRLATLVFHEFWRPRLDPWSEMQRWQDLVRVLLADLRARAGGADGE